MISDVNSIRQSCLIYRTRNLGDIVQTMALSRLLPRMAGVFRHDLGSAMTSNTFVVNGYLGPDVPPRSGATCLFAGVSGPYGYHRRYLNWMRRSPWPIGARDPMTAERLGRESILAEMVGCATLTLPRYEGSRQGIISVDFDGPGEHLSHWISRRMTLAQQWEAAAIRLERYRTAKAVYTTRLHVALPCIAFGTPVWIAQPRSSGVFQRFSLLDEMGVSYEKLFVMDCRQQAERYCRFLSSALRCSVEPHQAIMPTLTTPDYLALMASLRFMLKDSINTLRAVRARLRNLEPSKPGRHQLDQV